MLHSVGACRQCTTPVWHRSPHYYVGMPSLSWRSCVGRSSSALLCWTARGSAFQGMSLPEADSLPWLMAPRPVAVLHSPSFIPFLLETFVISLSDCLAFLGESQGVESWGSRVCHPMLHLCAALLLGSLSHPLILSHPTVGCIPFKSSNSQSREHCLCSSRLHPMSPSVAAQAGTCVSGCRLLSLLLTVFLSGGSRVFRVW